MQDNNRHLIGGAVPEQSDAALHARLSRQDTEAMSAIHSRYSGIVYRAAFRVLGDHGLAEDVSQEVFLRLWRKPERYLEERGSLGAWLAIAAKHRSVDLLRATKPTTPLTEALELTNKPSVEGSASKRFSVLAGLVAQLPENQRRVITLALQEELTQVEISEKTGAPLGTVKTRARAAVSNLRIALQALGLDRGAFEV